MNAVECPRPAELSEFLLGHLSRPAWARIAEHIEGCAACQAALETFDRTSDELLTGLRRPANGKSAGLDAVPLSLLATARVARGQCEPALLAGAGPHRLGKFELLE